jgi:hypothetical protein
VAYVNSGPTEQQSVKSGIMRLLFGVYVEIHGYAPYLQGYVYAIALWLMVLSMLAVGGQENDVGCEHSGRWGRAAVHRASEIPATAE